MYSVLVTAVCHKQYVFTLLNNNILFFKDWDFPLFQSNLDVKLPGVNTAHIKFDIPKCLKREKWVVHITGKWFNYGILFIVMLLDLNMWKNQIFYNPLDFGQYTGPDGKIYSVMDEWSLDRYKNETVYSYNWRVSTINPSTNQTYLAADFKTNSRFRGEPLSMRALAFIPSLLALIMFGALIYVFGREGTKQYEETDRKKQHRNASERITGVRISKIDPDSTDGGHVELQRDEQDNEVDNRVRVHDEKAKVKGNQEALSYGSTSHSPPVGSSDPRV